MTQGQEGDIVAGFIENLNDSISSYGDVIHNYAIFQEAARRLAEADAAIDDLNARLDTETQALYAEVGPESEITTIYHTEDESREWQPYPPTAVQGMPRPFIGDRLDRSPEGSLILVDSARRLAINNFKKLEVRPKDDPAVQEYSQEHRVEMYQRLGEKALESDVLPILTTTRDGLERTQPPL